MNVDWNRPLETVSKMPVRIICRDKKGYDNKIYSVGLVSFPTYETVQFYNKNGKCLDSAEFDLQNKKEECWANVYVTMTNTLIMDGQKYSSREEAVSHRWQNVKCVATVKFEFD